MSFCEKCGKELSEDSLFCESCGWKVPQEDLVEIPEERLVEKQTSEASLEEYSSHNKPKKKRWIILLLIIILIGVAGGGYWWFNHNNQKTVTQSSDTRESTSISTTKESSSTSTEQSTQPTFSNQRVSELADSTVEKLPNKTGIFVSIVNEENNDFEKNGNSPIRAASVIKLFLMEAFYREVNEGAIRLYEPYVLKNADKVSGTGVLQNYAEGTELTYEDIVRHMIVDSDNTAGNIIMNILGGSENTTKLIHNQGFKDTRVERKFVDTVALAAGKDNYTSAVDVGNLLKKIYQREAVSPQYDQSMLEVLKYNKNHSKLPKQIDSAIAVYNKTGEYQEYGVQNDACIFETNDRACIAVVLSEDGNESEQVSAMNEFGQQLGELLGEEEK